MRFVTPARLLAALSIGLMIGGCGVIPHYEEPEEQAAQADVEAQPAGQAGAPQAGGQVAGGNNGVEKIPFRVGVSTATVERLAKARACTGGPGAGLITSPGPVEVYRMQCDNGKVFMARCELRQCKPM